MDAKPPIEVVLGRMAGLLSAAGKDDWADRLRAQAARLEAEPLSAASAILDLYGGDHPLPTSAKGGYPEPGPEQEAAFEYARLRWRLYQGALEIWARHRSPGRTDPGAGEVERLSDHGGGHEVWRRGERYYVRYDAGAHFPVWREDEISEADAAQAGMGAVHFSNMILALQHRLKADGHDPWVSNFEGQSRNGRGRCSFGAVARSRLACSSTETGSRQAVSSSCPCQSPPWPALRASSSRSCMRRRSAS
jgi:hypothetical protein